MDKNYNILWLILLIILIKNQKDPDEYYIIRGIFLGLMLMLIWFFGKLFNYNNKLKIYFIIICRFTAPSIRLAFVEYLDIILISITRNV